MPETDLSDTEASDPYATQISLLRELGQRIEAIWAERREDRVAEAVTCVADFIQRWARDREATLGDWEDAVGVLAVREGKELRFIRRPGRHAWQAAIVRTLLRCTTEIDPKRVAQLADLVCAFDGIEPNATHALIERLGADKLSYRLPTLGRQGRRNQVQRAKRQLEKERRGVNPDTPA